MRAGLPPCGHSEKHMLPEATDPHPVLGTPCQTNRISLVVQTAKNLPAMQGTRIQPLGWEDPLEKDMATHSRILARRIPWTEEPGRLQSTESQSQTRLSNQH